MNIVAIIALVVWIYVLTVFKRGKMDYFEFLWGSVGLFVFMVIFVRPIANGILTELVTVAVDIIGSITGVCRGYYEYKILFITRETATISLYIDYECSGIIEMMAFVSMVMFFKVYSPMQRCIVSAISCIAIFFFNIVRIFVICLLIYFYGNDIYYVAHTIVGRFIFYVASVILYYYVFTKAQIISQTIGGFSYATNTNASNK